MKLKFSAKDVLGAFYDLAFILLRPLLFWLTWNYVLAASTNIPKLSLLQVVSVIVLFHILISYVPIVININKRKNG